MSNYSWDITFILKERENRKWGRAEHFSCVEGSQAVSVLLVEVRLRERKGLGSEKVKG
jgi:hypothetical protein